MQIDIELFTDILAIKVQNVICELMIQPTDC